MKPKPVFFFDVGGVVVDFRGGVEDIAQRLGTTPNVLMTVLKKYDSIFCDGTYSPQRILDAYEKLFGKSGKTGIRDFADYWAGFCQPVPGISQLGCDLQKNGFRTGLLTNQYPGVLDILGAKGFLPPVDKELIIHSPKLYTTKDSGLIWKVAENQAGVPPGQIYLLDDSVKNIERVTGLGWNGYHFDPTRRNDVLSDIRKDLRLNIGQGPEVKY